MKEMALELNHVKRIKSIPCRENGVQRPCGS
jgi:hypothetical protein